jgi:hypothetical protein
MAKWGFYGRRRERAELARLGSCKRSEARRAIQTAGYLPQSLADLAEGLQT